MRKRSLFFTFAACLISIGSTLSASILDLENHVKSELEKKNWKVVHEYHSPKGESYKEWVPEGQSLKNYKEMLTIASHDMAKLKKRPQSAVEIVEIIREMTKSSYPGSRVKWNVFRQSLYDVEYEWQLLDKYLDVEKQHEIIRIIFEGNTFFQVTFTKKVPEIDLETRGSWIQLLEGK